MTPCFRHVSYNKRTVLSSRRECNSKHCKQFCILFRECLYWQSNMHENVACLFAGYEQEQFLLWGTLRDKIYKMYSRNLCTKGNLREKEVKNDSKWSVYHFSSRTLIWVNNEYFRWCNRSGSWRILQLNSDEPTDTWASKLPQQRVAHPFNPGWATAVFQRKDHTHCLRHNYLIGITVIHPYPLLVVLSDILSVISLCLLQGGA